MLFNKENSTNFAENIIINICEPALTSTPLISRFFENYIIV